MPRSERSKENNRLYMEDRRLSRTEAEKAEWRAYQQRWKKANPVSVLLTSAKQRAKARGLEFSLTPADVTIPSHCPVLGIELQHNFGRMKANSPTLDRIDNSRGYSPDNIAVVSLRANFLKKDATAEELNKLARFYGGGK